MKAMKSRGYKVRLKACSKKHQKRCTWVIKIMKLKTLGKRLESIMQLFWGEKKLGNPIFEGNIPLGQKIEACLEEQNGYSGVWNIQGKKKYLKIASEIKFHPVKIDFSDYEKPEDAAKDAIRCAKFYKALANNGFYHPNTDVVVCKGREGSLTLMVIMPKLDCCMDKPTAMKINSKRDLFKRCTGMDMCCDLNHSFNWGYDKRTGMFYAIDMHALMGEEDDHDYKLILKAAKNMGIK